MGYTPPQLYVNKGTGLWDLRGLGATTEDLVIYPNLVDTTSIRINGNGSIYFTAGAAPSGLEFYNAATQRMVIAYVDPDLIIESKVADKNIYLKTAGTGTLKFGTFTGTGDLATNGYITVTDSGGTARRLAVVP